MSALTHPVPFGVLARTGETRPPLTDADLAHLRRDAPIVTARAHKTKTLALSFEVADDADLTQTGWGVLFASDADPAIREQLTPLIDHRRAQVRHEALFRVFEGNMGVRPMQTVANWAAARGVTLAAPVSPRKGVPFYLLLVGSPTQISFEFQQQLDLQWAVGRLHFDNVNDYGEYARKVVAYETGAAPPRARRVVSWMPRNRKDIATHLLAGTVEPDFSGAQADAGALGSGCGFAYRSFIGAGQATKSCLNDIFRGAAECGAPAVLFTGCHGAEWPMEEADAQRARQGALVTQEWTRGEPLQEAHYFAAADLPADAQVHGLVMFLFACFGGACPSADSYLRDASGTPIAIAKEPLIAALPQALLRNGALAVIAHVDRAFSYAFEDNAGIPQVQLLRTPLEQIMRGKRVGAAADALNGSWAALAAMLGVALDAHAAGRTSRPALLANLFVARDDARNYVVLGDPAARLDLHRLV